MAAIDSGYRTEGIADYSDPRETMRALPRFTQYPLTLFTGKALPGQNSISWWTPGFHLLTAYLSMALGVAAAAPDWDWAAPGCCWCRRAGPSPCTACATCA